MKILKVLIIYVSSILFIGCQDITCGMNTYLVNTTKDTLFVMKYCDYDYLKRHPTVVEKTIVIKPDSIALIWEEVHAGLAKNLTFIDYFPSRKYIAVKYKNKNYALDMMDSVPFYENENTVSPKNHTEMGFYRVIGINDFYMSTGEEKKDTAILSPDQVKVVLFACPDAYQVVANKDPNRPRVIESQLQFEDEFPLSSCSTINQVDFESSTLLYFPVPSYVGADYVREVKIVGDTIIYTITIVHIEKRTQAANIPSNLEINDIVAIPKVMDWQYVKFVKAETYSDNK
jgi:hypothetical protein